MAEGAYIRLMSERGPALARLDRTLREARELEKLLGELSIELVGSRLEGPPPTPFHDPEGLVSKIDATAKKIEAELASMRATITHIRRQI